MIIAAPAPALAWRDFREGRWQHHIDVGSFIRENRRPYGGGPDFLSGPTDRTTRLWQHLQELFDEERLRGIYDADPVTPGAITSHGPGYVDQDLELIVGLQTDAPLKRAIMPSGGLRMVRAALEAYGYELDPAIAKIFSSYRKTHNDAVFDAYPADVLAARRSHVITGLPDAYGRGRIIGDYRRVALYGVDRLIQERHAHREGLDRQRSTEAVVRDREELAEQIRALQELKTMATSYGYDISEPAGSAAEAIQWLYFAYLAAAKEQNGAATRSGGQLRSWTSISSGMPSE